MWLIFCIGILMDPGSAQILIAILKVQIADGVCQFITTPDGTGARERATRASGCWDHRQAS
jgi:hypothetical protein